MRGDSCRPETETGGGRRRQGQQADGAIQSGCLVSLSSDPSVQQLSGRSRPDRCCWQQMNDSSGEWLQSADERGGAVEWLRGRADRGERGAASPG